MTKNFAQYLTTLITNDVENKMSEDSMGISSYECEKVEAALMADKFDDVEKWVDGKTKKHSESKTMSRVQFDDTAQASPRLKPWVDWARKKFAQLN